MSSFAPYLISWNTTKRCNLRCKHCYLDSDALTKKDTNELSLEEGNRLIDQIAEVNPATMLILTGGEPLVREDIFDLSDHASKKGIMVVFGTNATTLDDKAAKEMVKTGVSGIGISIDSIGPEYHDAFRVKEGAWEKAMNGIESCKRHGLDFQIQTTVTTANYHEIPEIIALSHKLGARVFNLFFMVCTGRGQDITDISAEQYEDMLKLLLDIQGKYSGMMITARCAPHFKRLAYEKDPDSPITKAAGYTGGGCLAAFHYCRITPEGDVTPCPYIPFIVGNVKKKGFADIWDNSDFFQDMRRPKLSGRCGGCEFKYLCGGCRARAYATSKDIMAEDPWCAYIPREKDVIVPPNFYTDSSKSNSGSPCNLLWTGEAEDRLKRVPFFIRSVVIGAVERYAIENGYKEITPKIMEEARRKSVYENKIDIR
ncbi:MAG: radical SAM protein [Nitrospirota bacterium]